MKKAAIIDALAALAHENRLAIYRLLVARGTKGLAAGAIAERVGLAPSSLTFHLQSLHRAGLVTQTRVSRQLIYAADYDVVQGLVSYLTDNCCAESGSCAPGCGPATSMAARRKAAA